MWIEHYNKDTKTLTIPYSFNEEIKDIPEETEIIIFSKNYRNKKYSKFNQKVDNLQKFLTQITFGCYLTHLYFDNCFNQPVDNLPLSLTHLTFGRQTPVRLAHPKIMNIFIIV
jgi:hypothetical protein